MQRAFVLDKNRKPLMPCHPARARKLLRQGRAAVYRLQPFTIILIICEGGEVQPVELKVDPGSRTTGITIVINGELHRKVVWGCNLHHRGLPIKSALEGRRALRRGRRTRNTRYRKPRFDNRTRASGWLPPSIRSRVDNVAHWSQRIAQICPLTSTHVETVRFDLQKLEHPEISGNEYQQGTLFGYEIREYLLEKWGRVCIYCGAENVRLEIDHIVPKSRSGSNRVSNLTICCHKCNQRKGNTSLQEFLKEKPCTLKKIQHKAKRSLADAAAVNASRYAVGHALKSLQIPTSFWSGGRTKFNRCAQSYPKDHWIDAACVGETGQNVSMPRRMSILEIHATGRGSRQSCRVNKYGFPRTTGKKNKIVRGFKTGDLIKAVVPKGKHTGTYLGRVAVRSSGSFNIKTKTRMIQGISWKHCRLLQSANGYNYTTKEEQRFLPPLKEGVSALSN